MIQILASVPLLITSITLTIGSIQPTPAATSPAGLSPPSGVPIACGGRCLMGFYIGEDAFTALKREGWFPATATPLPPPPPGSYRLVDLSCWTQRQHGGDITVCSDTKIRSVSIESTDVKNSLSDPYGLRPTMSADDLGGRRGANAQIVTEGIVIFYAPTGLMWIYEFQGPRVSRITLTADLRASE